MRCCCEGQQKKRQAVPTYNGAYAAQAELGRVKLLPSFRCMSKRPLSSEGFEVQEYEKRVLCTRPVVTITVDTRAATGITIHAVDGVDAVDMVDKLIRRCSQRTQLM